MRISRFEPGVSAAPVRRPRAAPGTGRRFGMVIGWTCSLCLGFSAAPPPASGDDTPVWLRDRGTGIATSLFGTYVRRGELLFYPFYEYTRNNDQEYKPSELGAAGDTDFRGEQTENEALIFISYGLSDNVALEFECALYSNVTLHKSPDDPSALPSTLEESGLGDTQAEVRWRWSHETSSRPEFWSYFETVFPLQRDRSLIGTQDWEFVQGFGLTKGSRWGTVTARASAAYSTGEGVLESSEYALEFLKRMPQTWRWVLSLEGEQDEVSLIGEAQWHFSPRAFVKFNSGFGLTSKAPDVAPEVGLLFSL